jgi:hypothetical protein
MNDLSGPAVVRGVVDPGGKGSVRLINESSRQVITAAIAPDATFQAAVPQEQYRVEYASASTSLTALAASSDPIDLRRAHAVAFHVSSTVAGPGDLVVHVSVEGAGRHTFSVRTDNLAVADPTAAAVDLGAHGKQVIAWRAHVKDVSTPWVVVVLMDGSLNGHAELSGVR